MFLLQLAPDQVRDEPRLRYFLELVPSWTRIAVELRHPSWHDDSVLAVLERHQAAF